MADNIFSETMTLETYCLVSELPEKFSIARQTVYERLKFLGITPLKMDNKSHITATQLDLLERLHEHLQSGATMSRFDPDAKPKKVKDKTKTPITSTSLTTTERSLTVPPVENANITFTSGQPNISDLIQELAKAITSNQIAPYLSRHDALEKAFEKGWVLSSQEVFEIIGIKPKGTQKIWGCWQFISKGKIGRAKGWIVEKIDL